MDAYMVHVFRIGYSKTVKKAHNQYIEKKNKEKSLRKKDLSKHSVLQFP